MLLGITDNLQENRRIAIRKRIRLVTTVFIFLLFLPLVVYLLFSINLIPSKSPFSSDVQAPVAKVITETGVGTAFLINSTTLITARHVVENLKPGDKVLLIFEQSKEQFQTEAKIRFIASSQVGSIENKVPIEYFLTDLAVLEVPEITNIEPLVFGESDAVKNLDEVILIGYPMGDYSITKGNINSEKYQGVNLFKLDATSNPGNSGGPCILKDDNTVIGILVGSSATAQQGENVALKIDDVKKILKSANIIY
jgi:S1-C subfamily serine protease